MSDYDYMDERSTTPAPIVAAQNESKTLSINLSPRKVDFERFERVACSASALYHPNIVTIFELGQVDTTYYIAMELVEGELLRDMLTGGPIPLQKAIPIAAQTADGLLQ